MDEILSISNLKELEMLSNQLVDQIHLPTVILLSGQMGCGKTQFTKFLVSALKTKCLDMTTESKHPAKNKWSDKQAVFQENPLFQQNVSGSSRGLAGQKEDDVQVVSPTFTLHNTYHLSGFTVEHFDLFRLKNDKDLESIGFWEIFEQKQVIVVVEWADRLKSQDGIGQNWQKIHICFLKNTDHIKEDSRRIHICY